MCARSQTSGDISRECWRTSSSSSTLGQHLGAGAGAAQIVDDASLIRSSASSRTPVPAGRARRQVGHQRRRRAAAVVLVGHDGSSPRFPRCRALWLVRGRRQATIVGGTSAPGRPPLQVSLHLPGQHVSRVPAQRSGDLPAGPGWPPRQLGIVHPDPGRVAPPTLGGAQASLAWSAASVVEQRRDDGRGTVHQSPGCASMYRTSRCPRGLTWGNRVVRW